MLRSLVGSEMCIRDRHFGFQVLEGYGVTECSPVLAANQPGDIRAGTVGQLLPGIEHRLEEVDGLDNAGRLFVRGLNVMRGYLTADAPGIITPPKDGWHDTGDVVSIDDGGYVSIRGRLKRFAKIGGEMISLAIVENCASAVWPDHLHAAAILPDPRKGEQIILVTDRKDAPRSLLLAWAQSHGVPEIAVPKKIITVDEVPVLGTGKIDYLSVTKLAGDGLAELSNKAEEPETAFDKISRKDRKKLEQEEKAEKRRLARKEKNEKSNDTNERVDSEAPESGEPASGEAAHTSTTSEEITKPATSATPDPVTLKNDPAKPANDAADSAASIKKDAAE